MRETLQYTAVLPFDSATQTPKGVLFEDLLSHTELSKPGLSCALKRLVKRGEVFAYVQKDEYPKLRYVLRKNLHPQYYPEMEKKFFRKYRPILEALSTNSHYVELQTKLTTLSLIHSAFSEEEAFIRTLRLGASLLGRTQQAILQKLSHEISTYNNFRDFQVAGVHNAPTSSPHQITPFLRELLTQGLVKIESCMMALPSEKAIEELGWKIEIISKELRQMREETARRLKSQKRRRRS